MNKPLVMFVLFHDPVSNVWRVDKQTIRPWSVAIKVGAFRASKELALKDVPKGAKCPKSQSLTWMPQGWNVITWWVQP
jgi:hypothetical protein